MDITGGRTVILSDTHLGRPGCGARSADALRPLWAGATELIVNGDLAELSDPSYRSDAARQVLRVQELCEADGVHVCLLSGNHDPLITDRRYLRLFGGEVFLTHGDILHPAISPWTSNARRLEALHADALASLDSTAQQQFEARLEAAQYACHFNWDAHVDEPTRPWPRRMMDLATVYARVLWYWRVLPRRAADFARRYVPESRFFVFGHIHRSGIWNFDGRVIINTGSFDFPSKPRVVMIDNKELAVWPIRLMGETFELARQPLARFELNHITETPLRVAG